MRRSTPLKSTPQNDIEQGGSVDSRGINPIRDIDPPPSNNSNSSSFQTSTTYYSSPPSPPPSPNNNNTTNSIIQHLTNQPLQKILTTILRDTLIGLTLALLSLTLLFTLDYASLISIGSTKAFQTVGQELLSDPEVIAAIEHSLSLKLMPTSHYEEIILEIDANLKILEQTANEEGGAVYDYTLQLTQLTDEISKLQPQYDQATQDLNTKFGLDEWCGECKGGWGTCDGRVEYLRSTYGNSVVLSKVEIMGEGLCKKEG
eukprot:CAMPEP_0201726222 /NCGR_PEP_ID=MMETSP0593-20130828/9331_1 /ASSEMBLY_ACC=CAM_ASM_000672 /TAXON_ID=267983 /ORGANISM="Skeletonema japonicum, Strain CCMP2506" /LENGTH=258 /DNA_ID=CAMNT_0048217693 /DNA_START=61 /DNA_END=837 /DNA_ORIENTATION=+